MPDAAPDLLTSLLRDVSRSFYLTLRILPSGVRRPIGLAYLLARATDTIADTALVPAPERLEALEALRARILGRSSAPLDFSRLAAAQPAQASPAERVLLERVEEAVGALSALPEFDVGQIRGVLDTITGGQELDLRRFGHLESGGPGTGAPRVEALPGWAELDDYTYRVAGCVGEFWSRVCRRHLFPAAPLDEAAWIADGVRFGKGLQLVNILRDLPRDLRLGRCYLPADRLARLALAPADLLDPAREPRVRPLYDELLDLADQHLDAGWRYVLALPRDQRRIRLACAWPILIGVRTLAKLRTGRVLDPAIRLKVTRREVRGILWSTLWRLPRPRAWANLLAEARRPG